jgi:hypothetical protein
MRPDSANNPARPASRRALRLRIELSGKRLDLRFVDEVHGAGEAPADVQVFEIKPQTLILQLAWFRHGPPPIQ